MNKKSYQENTERKRKLTIALLTARESGLSIADIENLLNVSNSTALRYVKELGCTKLDKHKGATLGSPYLKWVLYPTDSMVQYARAILDFEASKVQE